MKNTRTIKKLSLNKATIRQLTGGQLDRAAGGDVGTSDLNTSDICTYTNHSCRTCGSMCI